MNCLPKSPARSSQTAAVSRTIPFQIGKRIKKLRGYKENLYDYGQEITALFYIQTVGTSA